jgi:cyanate permease
MTLDPHAAPLGRGSGCAVSQSKLAAGATTIQVAACKTFLILYGSGMRLACRSPAAVFQSARLICVVNPVVPSLTRPRRDSAVKVMERYLTRTAPSMAAFGAQAAAPTVQAVPEVRTCCLMHARRAPMLSPIKAVAIMALQRKQARSKRRAAANPPRRSPSP